MHPSIVGITGSAEEFFFARIGRHLKRPEQRASFATYAFGLLGDGDRKSVEPIAARVGGDPASTQRAHDHLLHFLSTSPWPDAPVRREAAKYVIEALSKREPVDVWIIDDTGMLKQGRHSPGVQRQYTGSAGKVANCQIAVSLSVATATEQVPIDCELYAIGTRPRAPRPTGRLVRRLQPRSPPQGLENAVAHGVQGDQPGELKCPVLEGQLQGRRLRMGKTEALLRSAAEPTLHRSIQGNTAIMSDQHRKRFQSGREVLEHYVPGYKHLSETGDELDWEQRLATAQADESRRVAAEFQQVLKLLEQRIPSDGRS